MQFIGGSISQAGQISTLNTRLNTANNNISSLVAKDIVIDQALNALSSGKVNISDYSAFSTTITSRVTETENQIQQIQSDLPNFINNSIVSEIQEQAGVVIQQQLLNESSPLYAKLLEKVDVAVQQVTDQTQNDLINLRVTVSTYSEFASTISGRVDTTNINVETLSSFVNARIIDSSNASEVQIQSLSSSVNASIISSVIVTDAQIQTLSTLTNSQISTLSESTNSQIQSLSSSINASIISNSNASDVQIQTLSTLTNSQISTLSESTTSQISTLSGSTNSQIQTLSSSVNASIISSSNASGVQIQTLSTSTNSQISTLSSFVNTTSTNLSSRISTLSTFVNTTSTNITSRITTLSSFVTTTSTNITSRITTLSTTTSTTIGRLDNTDYDWEKRFLSVEEYIRAMQQTYNLSYVDPSTNQETQFNYSGTYKGLPVPPPPFTIKSIVDSIFHFNITINISEYGMNAVGRISQSYNNRAETLQTTTRSLLLLSTRLSDKSVDVIVPFDKTKLYNWAINMDDSRGQQIYSLVITPELIEQYSPITNSPSNRILVNASDVGAPAGGWALDIAQSNTWRDLELVSPFDYSGLDTDNDSLFYENIASNTTYLTGVSGRAVLISRGAVSFGIKAQAAQAAGARMCIIYNSNDNDAPFGVIGSGGITGVTIPVVMIGNDLGESLVVRVRDQGEKLFATLLFESFEKHQLVIQDRRLNYTQNLYNFTELVKVPGSESQYFSLPRTFKWSFTPSSASVKAFLKFSQRSYSRYTLTALYKNSDPNTSIFNNVTINATNIIEYSAVNNNIVIKNRNIPPADSSVYNNHTNIPDLTINNLIAGETYIFEILAGILTPDLIDFGMKLIDGVSDMDITLVQGSYNMENIIDVIDAEYKIDFNQYTPYVAFGSFTNTIAEAWIPYLALEATVQGNTSVAINTTNTNIRIDYPDIQNNALRIRGKALPASAGQRYLPLLDHFSITPSQLVASLPVDITNYNFNSGNAIYQYSIINVQSASHLSFRWRVTSPDLASSSSANRDVALCILNKFASLEGNHSTKQVISKLIAYPGDSTEGFSNYDGIFDIELQPGYYNLGFLVMNENTDILTLADYQSYNNIELYVDDITIQPNSVYAPLVNPPRFTYTGQGNEPTNNAIEIHADVLDAGSAITSSGYVYSTVPNPSLTNGAFNLPVTPFHNPNYDWKFLGGVIENLNENTTYYVRGYANNASGIVRYSNEVVQVTAGRPVVNTVNIGSIVEGTNGYDVKLNMFIVRSGKRTSTFKALYAKVEDLNGAELSISNGTFSTVSFTSTTDNFGQALTLPNLEANKTYKITAYASNEYGHNMSSKIIEFTTPNGVPTVTLDADSPLEDNEYTVSHVAGDGVITTTINDMNILSTGGANITAKGVVYSKLSTDLLTVLLSTKTVDTTNLNTGIFSATLQNLEPAVIYYYRAYATNSFGTGYGPIRQFTTPISFPTVETLDVAEIAFDRVRLFGRVINNGGSTSNTTSGVLISSISTVPTLANAAVLQFGSGMQSNSVYTVQTQVFFPNSPLTPNTLYYVRAYATNSAGTRYGAINTFTTNQSTPLLSTSIVVGITNVGANAGGAITLNGGSAVTRRGVVYSTVNVNDGPDLNTVGVTAVDASVADTGSFVVSLSGLSNSTTYYVRAFAQNALGISYGLVTSFTTLASAPVFGTNTLLTSALATTSNGVSFYRGVPKNDPETNALLYTGSYRYAFTPNTSTVKIYVGGHITASMRYANEEAVTSIHKEGTTTSLLVPSAVTSINTNPLNSSYVMQMVSPNLSQGSNLQSANLAVITLNNLDITSRYVITLRTTANDYGDDIIFAVVNSSDVNIPIYFTNYGAGPFTAASDAGPRGGIAPLPQTPLAGTNSVLPSITTNNLQDVNIYTATMGATVQNIGSDMDPTTVTSGIVYGTSSTNLVKDAVGRTTVTLGTGSGSKTHNATGLLANTTYYVRAWVSSGFGISYGAVIPFTTQMMYDIQSVRFSNIQATLFDFTLNRVSSTGQLGYLYSTSNTNPVLTSSGATKVLVNGAVGQNTYTVTGLLEDTVYYVRPFISATGDDAVNIGYGQTISIRTKISNTENIAPDTFTNGTAIDFATVSNIYYKHSFTTGATDNGAVMQLYLRKIKPTTNNFIMHIVDGNGVSVMGPNNTTVAGNAQSTLINSGNNIVLSSPNTNVTATVTLTGLQSSTTYYIVNNVIDPVVGAEIQVAIAGSSDLATNLPITYVAASQSLSDIYTQLPYPVTYGLADGISIDANKQTTSTVNVNGDVRQFRTTPNPSIQNTVTFNLSSDNAQTATLNTVQYAYAHLSSSTPVYVTYGGVEYDLESAKFGEGVFVPGNTTYVFKTVARDAQVNPNGVVPAVVNVTSEQEGEGMYLVTIGTLASSEVALSFTKISAFRLIGNAFGVNGLTTDQYTLVKSVNNNYQFTLANVPFALGQFKIRTDSVWPQANAGVFDALDLELDSSSGLSGIRDSNSYESNLVFNGIPSTYNVTLVMTDIHRMKLMLVPSSGVAATRFVSSNATLSVGDVFYNKAGLTVSYTGSYSTSGLLVSASQNIQLGGAGVTSVFTQSNMNLSSFSYQFNAIENTTYYARYYVVDVNNSVVYSNEVTFTTPVKPALTVTNVVNDGNGNTVVTYNYVGQSLPFAFKKSIQSAFWSTTAEQEDVTITPQSGNGLTLSISGYTVREGLFVRVVDLVNAEYVSATYQVPSLYNNVVSVTGVTANNNELSVSYNVSGAFTGYNNSLTNPSMYVQYRIGSGVFNDYTLVQNKLAAASTGNTIVGYNGVLLLSAGTNVSFRFKIVDANGGYILSNVFVYSLSATHKSISVIPNRSAVTSTIFIDPATTVLLQGFGIGDNINRRVYLPFKNELDNAYYIVPVNPIMLEIDPPTPSALFMTYQDIPNANTLFVTASAMANQAVSVIYDEVSDKFKYNQTINGVVQAVVVERLPLAPPYDVFMWADDRVGNQLTIYYESSIASTVTIERFRNNGWDVIATTQLEISDDTSLTVTIPQAILDQSQVMDVLVFRLTDSSLTIKSCFPVINM